MKLRNMVLLLVLIQHPALGDELESSRDQDTPPARLEFPELLENPFSEPIGPVDTPTEVPFFDQATNNEFDQNIGVSGEQLRQDAEAAARVPSTRDNFSQFGVPSLNGYGTGKLDQQIRTLSEFVKQQEQDDEDNSLTHEDPWAAYQIPPEEDH